ncbi:hypothetical protein BGLT_04539 [Caballeronia glathei]|nr:hypothetical protein BGLT_04539 [Caballeronia glathei]
MRVSAPGQLQSFTGTARRTLKRRLRPESGLLPSEYKRHVIGLTWPSLPAVEAVRQCPVLNGLNSSVNPRHARAIAGSRAYAHPAFATPSSPYVHIAALPLGRTPSRLAGNKIDIRLPKEESKRRATTALSRSLSRNEVYPLPSASGYLRARRIAGAAVVVVTHLRVRGFRLCVVVEQRSGICSRLPVATPPRPFVLRPQGSRSSIRLS